ncbi:30S ribosomal protein S15 [archaeon]|nr:30S ribosomal protein S15 [archaeon]
MGRIYSGKKGKSGSTKPIEKKKKIWVRYDKSEVEQLILKYAKAGNTQSQIGLILRDKYGIPDVRQFTGNKLKKILEDNKLLPNIPEDLTNLIKRDIQIMKHLENNKKDMSAKRGSQLTESKINRLIKYYKRIEVLPKDWKYDRKKAKLLVS